MCYFKGSMVTQDKNVLRSRESVWSRPCDNFEFYICLKCPFEWIGTVVPKLWAIIIEGSSEH